MDLRSQLMIERVATDAARDLLSVPVQELAEAVTHYLERFGKAVGAARCTWFVMSVDLKRATSESEWCAPSMVSALGATYTRSELPITFATIVSGDNAVAFHDDPDDSPFVDLRDIVREEGIRCCLVVGSDRRTAGRGSLGTDYFEAPSVDAAFLALHRRFAEIVALAHDRRTEAQREEQVRASLAQKQRLETLGMLAGGIAHDFNNALQVIQASTEMLRPEVLEEGAKEYVELISQAADSASDLTSRMLLFGRDNADTAEWTATSEALNRVLEMMRRLIPESVETSVFIDMNLPPVPVRRGDFEQAVLNLVTNALHAMPDGGTLSISARRVHEPDGEYVMVSITDSGVGMSTDDLARAWDPFFTTKEAGTGTGLGLSIVQGMAHKAGGRVTLSSELGQGTQVSLVLPITTRFSERPPPKDGEGPTGTETVLVAEDNPLVRRVVQSILERAGYAVLTAAHGQAALELLGGDRAIDLVITDAVMPRIGGRKLYEMSRARGFGMPFLFCTGYSAATLDSSFLRQSGCEVLKKPCKAVDLLSRVRRALDRAATSRGAAGSRRR